MVKAQACRRSNSYIHPTKLPAWLANRLVRQLGLLSIPVNLRELQAGESPGDNYDLLYVELALEEPVVDAARLFCPGGLAGSSAILTAACERLLEASTWKKPSAVCMICTALAHQEVAVLPLWQLVEHFACHSSLKGVGQRPLGLYQNLGKWQCELRCLRDGTLTRAAGVLIGLLLSASPFGGANRYLCGRAPEEASATSPAPIWELSPYRVQWLVAVNQRTGLPAGTTKVSARSA